MVTSTEIIKVLKPHFPKICKESISIARNPEYGVYFSQKALKILKKNGITLEIKNQRKQPKRSNSNRCQVALNDTENEMLLKRLNELNVSRQDYLKNLIEKDLKGESDEQIH